MRFDRHRFVLMMARAVRFLVVGHGGLLLVLVISLAIRLSLLRWWAPFPFGDVFNFVRIAQELSSGSYPVDEKRLPFYPFLILVVHTAAPWLRWETVAIGLAIVMSLAALALLYALGRTVGLRKVSSLIGPLFLASYPPFLAYSIRGYADTTLVALFLGTLLAFFRAQRPRGVALFGALLGMLALTRYEGVAAGAVLGVLALVRWRRALWKIAPAAIACVVVLLPYVLIARHAGRSLLPTAYITEAKEEGVYGTASVGDFLDRHYHLWRRLGAFEAWRTPVALLETARADLYGLPRDITDRLREPRSAAALLAIPGVVWFILSRRGKFLLALILPFCAVAAVVAWYAPYVRYHAFVFPLVALSAGAGIEAGAAIVRRATVGPWGGAVRRGLGAVVLLWAVSVWLLWFTGETRENLRKSRFRERAQYEAVQAAQYLPGVIAFEERHGITEAYFGPRAVYGSELFAASTPETARWATLAQHAVTFVVRRPGRPSSFGFLSSPPRGVSVQETARFSVEQGNHDVDVAEIVSVQFF